ncbi:hypothetical protein KIN20_005221 [Parelaphostrongylus tenuis]|uniref:Uncharacterized protein n=1 Tax=Parelaphostrongylus tenuis TaxID=148309 RepID=A0AAD5MIJ9_PARTN|nr:hypothetical protein KIN20_005221 [Parelaphostrongylus tenuis]
MSRVLQLYLLIWSTPESPRFLFEYLGLQLTAGCAQAFVERLVMQTVFDVLESQARSALLPETVISLILGQLTVKVTYTAMKCLTVLSSPTDMTEIGDMPQNCIFVGIQ